MCDHNHRINLLFIYLSITSITAKIPPHRKGAISQLKLQTGGGQSRIKDLDIFLLPIGSSCSSCSWSGTMMLCCTSREKRRAHGPWLSKGRSHDWQLPTSTSPKSSTGHSAWGRRSNLRF